MDKSVDTLLTGQYTVESLLMLFILLLITKRIVPWWIYEQLERDYKELKARTESMTDTVDEYIRGYKDALSSVNNNRRRNLQSAGGRRSVSRTAKPEGDVRPCEGRSND